MLRFFDAIQTIYIRHMTLLDGGQTGHLIMAKQSLSDPIANRIQINIIVSVILYHYSPTTHFKLAHLTLRLRVRMYVQTRWCLSNNGRSYLQHAKRKELFHLSYQLTLWPPLSPLVCYQQLPRYHSLTHQYLSKMWYTLVRLDMTVRSNIF